MIYYLTRGPGPPLTQLAGCWSEHSTCSSLAQFLQHAAQTPNIGGTQRLFRGLGSAVISPLGLIPLPGISKVYPSSCDWSHDMVVLPSLVGHLLHWRWLEMLLSIHKGLCLIALLSKKYIQWHSHIIMSCKIPAWPPHLFVLLEFFFPGHRGGSEPFQTPAHG